MKDQFQSDIDHQPIDKSSSVKTIGYDKETRELHVAFHGSGVYVYQNVPPEKHEGLMMAGSKGQYIHRHIKGRHQHIKT